MNTKHSTPAPGASVYDIATGLSADSHYNAITKAIDWLADRHRKGFRAALEEWTHAVAPDDTDLADADLDDDAAEALTVNATEWLLARGEIFAKGGKRNINAYLLGPGGPWFSPAQQRWIAQLAAQPLRLWRVTDVRKGQGLTLVDAIDGSAEPVSVQERSGSQTAQVGMLLGARLMAVGDQFQLSGATYPISRPHEAALLDAVTTALAATPLHPDNRRNLLEWEIARAWLAQFFVPPAMPSFVDAGTGDPMLLITDHYRVADSAALAVALAAQPDVEGDAHDGWRRVLQLDPDSTRILLSINPGKSDERIEVFARTQALADSGRAWFETVAGGAVAHLTREITDPHSPAALAEPGASSHQLAMPDLTPEQKTAVFQQFMRQHYAKWADKPIPMLDNKTARQAMATPAGLERVKGLIREYETREADMAARDGRAAISYQFLWDSLGISR